MYPSYTNKEVISYNINSPRRAIHSCLSQDTADWMKKTLPCHIHVMMMLKTLRSSTSDLISGPYLAMASHLNNNRSLSLWLTGHIFRKNVESLQCLLFFGYTTLFPLSLQPATLFAAVLFAIFRLHTVELFEWHFMVPAICRWWELCFKSERKKH